jgi:hypothetical protein
MRLKQLIRDIRTFWRLPPAARQEHHRDVKGLRFEDPGIEMILDRCMGWLCRAQDCSASQDGGVARHFSLVTGWGSSYPETTGYIIPTILDAANKLGDEGLRIRAKRMLDWLVSIQFADGAFQGGVIGAQPTVPVIFNTGQILIGLARGVQEFGEEYVQPMRRAADWLVAAQDADGCWRKYESPFAMPGERAYDTHVAWGLMDAARVDENEEYRAAGLANVRWAASLQAENGWIDRCCLSDPKQPLTHTIGYALRGMIEAYRYSREQFFLDAAQKTADGLLGALSEDGFLPGRLDHKWSGTVSWACLTGTSQIALCWLLLFQATGERKYWNAARTANRYVRRTVRVDGPEDTRGGVKGSFPISGGYGSFEYLNWACKFLVDATLLEKVMQQEARDQDETGNPCSKESNELV